MSLISRKGLLHRIRRGKKTRSQLVASNLSEGVAFQIRATRDRRGMTQIDLAREAGMTQNNLSRLESPDYGKHTITSLKRIADALDVALVVRFVPFSQYIDWLSATPHVDAGLIPEALAVASFEDEENAELLVESISATEDRSAQGTGLPPEPIWNAGANTFLSNGNSGAGLYTVVPTLNLSDQQVSAASFQIKGSDIHV